MKFYIPGLSGLSTASSAAAPILGIITALISTLLSGGGVQAVKMEDFNALLGGTQSSQTSSELVTSDADLQKLLDALPGQRDGLSVADSNGGTGYDANNASTPQDTPPNTEFFLAASLPKASGNSETIHPVVFSYMHNNAGTVEPVAGGTWSGTINGKSITEFDQVSDDSGATAGMLAIRVQESELKDFNVVYSKDGKDTAFVLADPQLNPDSQTTLFVAGN